MPFPANPRKLLRILIIQRSPKATYMLFLVQFWPLRLPSYWVMVSNLQLFPFFDEFEVSIFVINGRCGISQNVRGKLFSTDHLMRLSSHEFLAYFLNILSTYVCCFRYWSNEWSSNLHQGRPQNQRRTSRNPRWNPQPLLPHWLLRRRKNLRLDRPTLHHRGIPSHLLRRSYPHGLRHQLRLPYGRPLRRRHWRWLCAHDRSGLHLRGRSRHLSWLP
jgi:hypothetical protein